jgi:hypothetical protein
MKFNQNQLVVAAVFLLSGLVANADISADKIGVESACVQEAATAQCGQDKVGTGLIKCLRKYRKENKGYKFGESCKGALKQLHKDRRERKSKTH